MVKRKCEVIVEEEASIQNNESRMMEREVKRERALSELVDL